MIDLAKKTMGIAASTGVDQAEVFAVLSRSLRVKV
jgi:hypothetical protein